MLAGGFVGGLPAVLFWPKSIPALLLFSIVGGGVAAWVYASHRNGSDSNLAWTDIWPIALGMSWASMPGGFMAMIAVDRGGPVITWILEIAKQLFSNFAK